MSRVYTPHIDDDPIPQVSRVYTPHIDDDPIPQVSRVYTPHIYDDPIPQVSRVYTPYPGSWADLLLACYQVCCVILPGKKGEKTFELIKIIDRIT